jgi:hypothetical protein
MTRTLMIMTFVLLLCSCASSVNVLKPEGETASIELYNSQAPVGEILAVSDSMLYFMYANKINVVDLSYVRKIFVHGYSISPGTKMLAAIPPLFLEGLVMAVAFSEEAPAWGYISIGAMVLTIYGISTGNPKVSFSPPLKEKELKKLKLYCRYPQGLTLEQWNELLRLNGQEDFLRPVKIQEEIP